jgi:integrase
VPAELVGAIEQHLGDHVGPSRDALVFTGPEGQPLGRNKFRPIWVAARAAAGISGLYFHDLPGSGPTWAAEAGATVREVMERLGHTTATIALSYRHATQERDRAIADKPPFSPGPGHVLEIVSGFHQKTVYRLTTAPVSL